MSGDCNINNFVGTLQFILIYPEYLLIAYYDINASWTPWQRMIHSLRYAANSKSTWTNCGT